MSMPAIDAARLSQLPPDLRAKLNREVTRRWHAETLGNPEWRIDNLYCIQDKHGQEVKFVRNRAQRRWWVERHCLNIVLKARQLGFSVVIALEMLDECVFNANFRAGIIDYSLEDAKKKLEKIKFAYARLPEAIRNKCPLVRENTQTLEFANGSVIEVGTSHRGGTLQHLHVSEFGKISVARADKALEIKTGGFGTVHVGHRIDVESTAEGQGGEFYEMVQRADRLAKEGRALSELDFKFHFFSWDEHDEYRLAPRGILITKEVDEYFERLKAEHGKNYDPDQIAWYAAKQAQIGPDMMYREYPSYPEEAFQASLEGAYFKRQMDRMRRDGRLGHVPYDDGRVVNTFWDIGNDATVIWFHQTDGLRHRLIDYYENSDESITHYVREVMKRADSFGWALGRHYFPHDMENSDWGNPGARKTRAKMAEDAGLRNYKIIPRIDDKDDAIDAARMFLNNCWIDEANCAPGIRCLDNYQQAWNERLGTWSREPLHNWACHAADSLMTGAMGYRPEKDRKPAKAPLPVFEAGHVAERGTGWMMR